MHYLHQGVMPPGAIGSRQLQRGGPLPGFFQPVEIKAPPGALVSLAVDGRFDQPQPAPRKAGMLIGAVYRLRVTNTTWPKERGSLSDHRGHRSALRRRRAAGRFAIPVEITEDDLRLAADGKFVTRVIYLEDPRQALPAREDPQSKNWFEAAPGQDPLAVADGLGRPVAILRLGGRLPEPGRRPNATFFYGSPPFVALPLGAGVRLCPEEPLPPETMRQAAVAEAPVGMPPAAGRPTAAVVAKQRPRPNRGRRRSLRQSPIQPRESADRDATVIVNRS